MPYKPKTINHKVIHSQKVHWRYWIYDIYDPHNYYIDNRFYRTAAIGNTQIKEVYEQRSGWAKRSFNSVRYKTRDGSVDTKRYREVDPEYMELVLSYD